MKAEEASFAICYKPLNQHHEASTEPPKDGVWTAPRWVGRGGADGRRLGDHGSSAPCPVPARRLSVWLFPSEIPYNKWVID